MSLNVQAPDAVALTVYATIVMLSAVGLVVTGKIFGSSNPNPVKNSPFECGQPSVGKPHLRFNIKYYHYAMIYAVFGALAVFLLLTAPALIRLPGEVLTFVSVALGVAVLSLISAVISLRSVR